ncbi:MBL fold metallo-hydrolase [uncultured Pseudokineococcus sp.]|uniref:MBL fold metallo-hydrolase n=1 Tax=uncultured Pseudokineococcus sp. TaxID=1642928 RepID=UPI00263401E1|nr:MBL fold metallo-hydrolase [uncultured Pseudokineococcus sp.]
MRITHLGHSTLLVEAGGARVLLDPGVLTPGWEDLRDLDAVVVTHAHPDHLDPAQGRFEALRDANPGARVLAEPQTAADGRWGAEALAAGATTRVVDLPLRAVGGEHAVIHDDIPVIGNVGVLLGGPGDGGGGGEPVLFHPGDAYTAVPEGVDVLAAPLTAPWTSLKETVAFTRAVGPRLVVPIHDAIVSGPGRGIYLSQLGALGPEGARVLDLAGAGATEVPDA